MQNYLKKVIHILPIFMLAVFLCVVLLGLARYFLDFKFHLIDISDKAWNIFLPMILSALSLIIIRKRFSVLKHSDPTKDNFIYLLICGIVLCALVINSQMYLDVKFSKNQTVENIHQLSSDKNVNRIRIKSYFVDDGYLNSKYETNVSGKYNDKLNFHFYFISAILKDSLENPKDDLPTVWFVNKFSKTINNRLSDEKKNIEYKNFREKCRQDLNNFNFHNNSYFLRVSTSDEKRIYDQLIRNVVENPLNKKLILLAPSNGKFVDDGKSILSWFFKILGIGILIILVALLFPNYKKTHRKKKYEEDDFIFFIKLFIPSKQLLITPILINLNILVFIVIAFMGVNPFYPRTEDLVEYGALTSSVFKGEYWRIISSMFMHAGIMHLVMNLIVLSFVGFFSENIFGKKRFLFIYLLSGIIAGIFTLLWHHGNIVGVGASGAIFGLLGANAMLLILQNNFKETKGVLLIIFGYLFINILLGIFSNADNATHISGFVTGMMISIMFYYFKK